MGQFYDTSGLDLSGAVNAGLALGMAPVRAYKETAEIIRDREQRKQAQEVLGQIEAKKKELAGPLMVAQKEYENAMNKKYIDGEEVSEEKLKGLQRRANYLGSKAATQVMDLYAGALASAPDNPYIQESVKQLHASALNKMQGAAQKLEMENERDMQQSRLETERKMQETDHAFAKSEAEVDRGFQREMFGREVSANREAREDKQEFDARQRAKDRAVDVRGQDLSHDLGSREVSVQESREKRLSDSFQLESAMKLGQLLEASSGLPPRTANRILAEAGLDITHDQLRDATEGFSKETKEKIAKYEAARNRAEKRGEMDKVAKWDKQLDFLYNLEDSMLEVESDEYFRKASQTELQEAATNIGRWVYDHAKEISQLRWAPGLLVTGALRSGGTPDPEREAAEMTREGRGGRP